MSLQKLSVNTLVLAYVTQGILGGIQLDNLEVKDTQGLEHNNLKEQA